MRILKRLAVILVLLSPSMVIAQIQFDGMNKWAAILAKAKSENKLVFVDVYTDWCGPCKKMDKEVFPLAVVGKLYNDNFINVKIDAEKAEGPNVAKQYLVVNYPSYLFINGDGVLIHRAGGAMAADDFLREGKAAVAEAKEPYTVLQMQNEYPLRKADKEFMYTYLSRLTKLKLPVDELLNEYIAMLDPAERAAPRNIKLTADNATWLNRKLTLGPAYENLMAHIDIFDSLVVRKKINNESLSGIQSNVMDASLKKAIRNKDEALLAKVIALTSPPHKNPFHNQQTVALNYYLSTGNQEQYKTMATDFVRNTLLSIPADSLAKWDLDVYVEEKAYCEKQKDTSVNNPDYIYSYRHSQTIQLTNAIVEICENMLRANPSSAETRLMKAWANKIVAIAYTDTVFYKNVMAHYRRVRAAVLYQAGEKQAARKEITALLAVTTGVVEKKALHDILGKMK